MVNQKYISVIKKIHADSDDTCHQAIFTSWQALKSNEESERLFTLIASGLSIEEAAENLELDLNAAKALFAEYQERYCNDLLDSDKKYDRLFKTSQFYKLCDEIISNDCIDSYFSINSFYNKKRRNTNIRHLNAIVLDLDYYDIPEFANLTPTQFYKKIKKHLPQIPTAVIDSGHGLYVIYTFKHCSYHMERLYKCCWKYFYKKFEKYGMDPKAMLTTQLIRIPGTINSKTGRRVSVLDYNDTAYTLQDFAALLPWTIAEVKEHRQHKMKKHKKKSEKKAIVKDITCRQPYFKDFYIDCEKLIKMRNANKQYDGYREELLYLVRERATWSGYSIHESVKIAQKLNQLFITPLSKVEVEKNCKPSDGRKNSSIDTIIDKLRISTNEQLKLKILRRKALKKSLYAKRKQKHPLLNRTVTQQRLLERRTYVCKLKNEQHLKNKDIADKLDVDKSTVTRDINYIRKHPAEFVKKLKAYMDEVEASLTLESFRRTTLYKKYKQLSEWLKVAETALDFLVRELRVAKN